MSEEPETAAGGKHYVIGDVGAGARVMQGEGNSWNEGVRALPGGEQLARELAGLLDTLKADTALEPDDQELAVEKTQAVANALPGAAKEPDRLRRALRDARQFLGSKAQWAWDRLREALTSDTGRAVLGTIGDAAAKAAIISLLGVSVPLWRPGTAMS
jgi:hypothetical protein